MGRQKSEHHKCAMVVVTAVALLLVTHGIDAKRSTYGNNNRKTSSGSGHVTRPPYNTNSNSGSSGGSNSHADVAKLSYPNYNSQPNRPASGGQDSPQIGWNVPKQQGPPPAYSASNPVGGAKTNVHEAPPAYHGTNAAPPSYGASNVHTPITASNSHGVQSGYPMQQMPAGATYHSPGALPAGATYYPGGHAPAGGSYYPGGHVPAGGSYYPGGHSPAGGGYYNAAPAAMPPGASYYPAGQIPAGATYYSQPPQSSSGLGFGSGLAAGAIGGAILGHVLTPTQTRTVDQASGSNSGGGDGKVIIINNGPPGTVTSQDGTTVITTGAAGAATVGVAGAGAAANNSAPLAPMNGTPAEGVPVAAAPPPPPPVDGSQPPPAGGIICVPMRVNETDPADSSKMIEVEKIACYPAPPPPASEPVGNNTVNGDTTANLAPILPMQSGHSTQQLQQTPLAPEQSTVHIAGSGGSVKRSYAMLIFSSLVVWLITIRMD